MVNTSGLPFFCLKELMDLAKSFINASTEQFAKLLPVINRFLINDIQVLDASTKDFDELLPAVDRFSTAEIR